MGIKIPLELVKGRLERTASDKESIDNFISLLLTTPYGSLPSDREFGFVLNNLRFEIFNEREGVVYNSQSTEWENVDLYSKKISGTSLNLNTFAVELKNLIEKYEQRLQNVMVVMSYKNRKREISIEVKAIVRATLKEYNFHTRFNIWSMD